MDDELALVGGTLIDGTGKPAVSGGTVLIKGDEIVAVGLVADVTVPQSARVIDVSGKTLMPALADMHVHLAGGWDGESSEMLGYQRYLNALLYAGVCTVFDVGNVFPYVVQLRREIESRRIQGPRMYIVGPILDGPDPVWFPLSQVIASVDQVPRIVDALSEAGVDMLKAYSDLPAKCTEAIVSAGEKRGLKVILDAGGRLNGSRALMAATGIKAWAHLCTSGVMPSDDIEYMAKQGISQLTTLSVFEAKSGRRLTDLSFLEEAIIADTAPSYVIDELSQYASEFLNRPLDSRRERLSMLETALKNAKALYDGGVMLVAGTDAPYPGDFQGEGVHRELELLVEAGLSPVEAIACATGNAAKFVGAEGKWGSLNPGCQADVIVVSGHPEKDIHDTHSVDMVIQHGQVLDREGLKYNSDLEIDFRPVKGIT